MLQLQCHGRCARGAHSGGKVNQIETLLQQLDDEQRQAVLHGEGPLLVVAGSERRMGELRLGGFLLVAGWGSCALITALDLYGLPGAFQGAIAVWQRLPLGLANAVGPSVVRYLP